MIGKLLAGLILFAFSSAAFSGSCPLLMSDIDAALEDPAVTERLSEEELMEARQLREQGEEAHRSGDHAQSMEALNRAKEVLEIS
jgi:hypothetical protein